MYFKPYYFKCDYVSKHFMKIAIVGTRGIPNNYGGFEQLAQFLSLGLHEKGHQVYVYSSHKHIYQEKTWKGIHIIHKYDPEKKIGTIGQFIYDFNCILDTRKRNFDVILNLGYTSSSVWMHLFSSRSRLITNMDGLEWKRSKYSKRVQHFLLYAEKLAIRYSDHLIADSRAIRDYLLSKYGVHSTFIAYGAPVFSDPQTEILEKYSLSPFAYSLLIARMEPENNIEMILDGVVASSSKNIFLVVGSTENKYGAYLRKKFKSTQRILFTGPIYDEIVINNLRYYSGYYFHGHSVGGTNPSLLEAMGCRALIAAHNNDFNKSVLGPDAYYFSNADSVAQLLNVDPVTVQGREVFIKNNIGKIRNQYSWERIVEQYEQVMTRRGEQ